MKLKLADGDAYIKGRSPQKARELQEAAEAAGIDFSLVRTTSGGYIVPKELGGEGGDASRLEIGHGLNETRYRDGIDDEQVMASVGSNLLAAIQPVADAGAVEGAILNQSTPTDAKTVGKAEGNGSQTVGDSAVLTQDRQPTDPTVRQSTDSSEDLPVDPDETDQQATDVNTFDPADHTVEQVEAYLETADETERQRVLDAETNGKARKSLVGTEEGK